MLLFLPCDFSVEDKDAFVKTIQKAKVLANDGYICAIGTKPTSPETGYGYIKAGESIKKGRKILQFKEKPSVETAKKYLKKDNYFWNCGIYIAKKSVLVDALQEHAPEIISGMDISMFDEHNKIKYSFYENLPTISVDYAVIEK